MNFDFVVFIFGCIGAAAPEIVRVYRTKRHNFDITWKNMLVSVLFFLLGGAIAIALESPSWYAAFYSGVATPIIVSKLVEQPPSPQQKISQEQVLARLSPTRMPSTQSKLTVREYLWMLNASR